MGMCVEEEEDTWQEDKRKLTFTMHRAHYVFTVASKGFRLIIPGVSACFGFVPLIGATLLYFAIGYINENFIYKRMRAMVRLRTYLWPRWQMNYRLMF